MDTFDKRDLQQIDDLIECFLGDIQEECIEWYGYCENAMKMRNAIIKGLYEKTLDNLKQL